MKKFSNFNNNVLSRTEMKNAKGGMLRTCTCTSGNNSGSGFLYSTSGSSDGAENEYRSAVCNGGNSSCVDTIILVPV